MAKVITVERKSSVLKHPALPCLSRYHTINLTAGCPFECRYCYAQSFRNHAGKGNVAFYGNSLELLRREFPRKRKKPELVYFSTACEPFMPHKDVLISLYGAMELLLSASVSILISTKAHIPSRFLRLFAGHPGLVFVQVGVTTVNDRIRKLLEPKASPAKQRLETLQRLAEFEVECSARMDPLIPELTDTEESFTALCRALKKNGVRKAVASYLFLRQATFGQMNVQLSDWTFREMAKRLYTHRIENYCGCSTIRIPSTEYRIKQYQKLKRIAAAHGILLGLCNCKNPDVTTNLCHPEPPKRTVNTP